MSKKRISYEQLVWQGLAIEHFRTGCRNCAVGGCISHLRYDEYWDRVRKDNERRGEGTDV